MCLVGLFINLTSQCGAEVVTRFASLPPFDDHGFNSAAYLRLAIEIQSLGEQRAVASMRELAKRKDNSKLIPLCRMLFVARQGRVFRAPWIGQPAACPRSDGAGWPLEPIAIVDGVPFLITIGYELGGFPEPGGAYLEYCVAECTWNPERFVLHSRQGIHDAYKHLLALVHLNTDYERVWLPFLEAQVKEPN